MQVFETTIEEQRYGARIFRVEVYMSSDISDQRPTIKDIVSGQGNVTVSGMSDHDVANLLAPLSSLSGDVFYGAMKAG